MSYKRYTVSCLDCKTEISARVFSKHNHDYIKQDKRATQKVCEYCGITTKSNSHSFYCKKNPDQNIRKSGNQFTKADKTGIPYVYKQSTKDKRKAQKPWFHTEETKRKMRIAAEKNVKEKPENYRGRYNRGFVKSITCSNGFVVLGSWEQRFVEYCIDNNIQIEQPNIGFSYLFEGKEKIYFPDFYLPYNDTWVEIKGYKTDKDAVKWDRLVNNHNKRMLIVDKTNINDLDSIVPRTGIEPVTKDL